MQIGQLAKKSGFKVETIRFYEREGVLPAPNRSLSGYRLYDKGHLEQLQFIKHCRMLSMGLSDIKLLLNLKNSIMEDCSQVDRLIQSQLKGVRQKIKDLKTLEKQLRQLSKICHGATIKECKILDSLSSHGKENDPICTRAKRNLLQKKS